MSAADEFEAAFYRILERNPHDPPSPTQLKRELGMTGGRMNVINGKQTAIRTRLLLENNFVKSDSGRWEKGPQSSERS